MVQGRRGELSEFSPEFRHPRSRPAAQGARGGSRGPRLCAIAARADHLREVRAVRGRRRLRAALHRQIPKLQIRHRAPVHENQGGLVAMPLLPERGRRAGVQGSAGFFQIGRSTRPELWIRRTKPALRAKNGPLASGTGVPPVIQTKGRSFPEPVEGMPVPRKSAPRRPSRCFSTRYPLLATRYFLL